jgi:hypothetical protein
MTESDRELLAPLLTAADQFMFGRAGGSPTDIADFDRIATRLVELQHEGYVVFLGAPTMDHTRPGDHYYSIRARLTPRGVAALRSSPKS